MKFFPKKIWVNSIYLAVFTSVANQAVCAAEESTLPTLTLQAEESAKVTTAQGQLATQAKLSGLGQKKIIDTPFSVTEYTEKIIQDQQASTVAEVLRNDASIRTSTNQGHLNENFIFRGFALNYDDMSYNGLYGMAPMSRIPTEFLESVTVLKGPNALVGGIAPTGGVGGVIIANSKKASNVDVTRVSSSFEDESFYKTHIDISRRFGEQKQFGIRTNLAYGEGEHIIEGMDDRLALGSIAADYTTDKLKINLDAYAIRESRKGGSPAMVSLQNLSSVIQAPDGDTNYFSHIQGQTDSQFVGLNGEYKFTPNLKAFAGVGYVEKDYSGHMFGTRMILTNSQGDATSQYYNTASKEHNVSANIGFETLFNTGSIQHTLGLRADYLTREYTQHSPAKSVAFTTNLYNPSTHGQMPEAPNVVPYGDAKYVSYLLTDQISMLDDKLQFILGARYQDMDIKVLPSSVKSQYSENKLSPSVGIVIKPFGENISFYTSYVEGLSQGSTVDITLKDVNAGKTFAPFQTEQYEIGAKVQTGTWLNTLALYQIEKPALMTTKLSVADVNGNTQMTSDGAETRSRGVEWAFSGNIISDLSILGNLAYTDTEVTKAVTNQGKTVIGVPKYTGALGLGYDLPMLQGLNLNARLTYVGTQYLRSDNSLKLPDYMIVDVGARYKTKVGGVNTTFLANVDNIMDKNYWEGVFNNNYAIIGGARTYKVGVTFDF